MGKPDMAVKHWLNDNERFADLFNGTVFGGRRVIRADETFVEGKDEIRGERATGGKGYR